MLPPPKGTQARQRRLASQPAAAHQYIDEQDNQENREDARGRIAIRMIPPGGEAPDQEQDHQHKQEQLHRKTPSRRRGPGEGLHHPAATRTATKPSHPHRAGWQDEDSRSGGARILRSAVLASGGLSTKRATLIGSRALAAYDDVDGPSAANNRPWSRKCTARLLRRSDASASAQGYGGTRSVRLAGEGSVG